LPKPSVVTPVPLVSQSWRFDVMTCAEAVVQTAVFATSKIAIRANGEGNPGCFMPPNLPRAAGCATDTRKIHLRGQKTEKNPFSPADEGLD